MYIRRNYSRHKEVIPPFPNGVRCEYWDLDRVHYLPIIRMNGKIAKGVESPDFELENEEELKALEKGSVFLKTKWEF